MTSLCLWSHLRSVVISLFLLLYGMLIVFLMHCFLIGIFKTNYFIKQCIVHSAISYYLWIFFHSGLVWTFPGHYFHLIWIRSHFSDTFGWKTVNCNPTNSYYYKSWNLKGANVCFKNTILLYLIIILLSLFLNTWHSRLIINICYTVYG